MVIQNQPELCEGSTMPTDPHHIPTIVQPSSSQPQKTQKPRKPTRKDLQEKTLRGKTLQSGEDSMNLDELMALCTTLQNRVLDLEQTKTTQCNEIDSLKRRVKNLEKRNRSRTHKLKRLYKVGLSARVEPFGDKESLGEDASKQERGIDVIDADEDITLVNVADNETFDVDDLGGEEVFVARKNDNVIEKVVNAAQVSTATTTVTITTKKITKGIMIKELVKPKKKDQIRLDEEAAKKLQAEFNE
nr:hypothetical protein [Tanacetum cinerariifolium]